MEQGLIAGTQFHPEKSQGWGTRLLENFAVLVRERALARHDRHSGRRRARWTLRTPAQGRADAETVFGDDPVATAARWASLGAARLHVVDLDGAFLGSPRQTALVARMIAAVAPVPVEVGGGLRDEAAIEACAGGRCPLGRGRHAGSARPDVPGRDRPRWPDRIIVAVDAHGDRVAVKGWTETQRGRRWSSSAARARRAGAAALLYTDVSRDGTGLGPNVEATATLAGAVPLPVLASGGVGQLDDLRALAAIPGVAGAVVGRALYTGAIDLREALSRDRPGVRMLAKRVIPCLDVKDGRVVKGVRFVDLRDAGDPVEAALAYDVQGADELVFLDITASHEERDVMLDVVRRARRRAFTCPSRWAVACAASTTSAPCYAPAPTRFRSTQPRWRAPS